jgi:hypothetical protein
MKKSAHKKPPAGGESESDDEAIGDGSSDGEEEDSSSSGSDGGAGSGDEDSDEDSEDETERAKRELADVPFGVLQVCARLVIAAQRFYLLPTGRCRRVVAGCGCRRPLDALLHA